MDASQFQQLVAESRTYRRYGARPLSREELLGLVEAARLAPTGNNSQQLRFRVVPGMEDPAGCQLVFSHLHWAAALPDWNGPEADERPGGYVLVCLPHKAAKNPVRLIDVGIAAQTLALAAAARGLGTCMHKSYDACLGTELGLEGLGLDVALVLAVGERGEKVVLERAGVGAAQGHGLTYWRDLDRSHHVPKLSLEELLV